MGNNLFTLYLDEPLSSKKAVYHFLATHITQDLTYKKTILRGFQDRENAGNIQIAHHTILPHLKLTDVPSQIIILRTANTIEDWSTTIARVRLIIAVLLSTDATSTEKKTIQQFIKKLAQDDYINLLLSCSKGVITDTLEV